MIFQIIPQSQFDGSKFKQFNLHRLSQCADIQKLDSDIEAIQRGLNSEIDFRNKQDKIQNSIAFGPVVIGEATAVTDHIDVYQYYQLVSETKPL